MCRFFLPSHVFRVFFQANIILLQTIVLVDSSTIGIVQSRCFGLINDKGLFSWVCIRRVVHLLNALSDDWISLGQWRSGCNEVASVAINPTKCKKIRILQISCFMKHTIVLSPSCKLLVSKEFHWEVSCHNLHNTNEEQSAMIQCSCCLDWHKEGVSNNKSISLYPW